MFYPMKVKTTITLPGDVVAAIDRHTGQFRSRSRFLEASAREFLAHLAVQAAAKRDVRIITRRAAALNAEAADVLSYPVPM